MFKIVSQCVVFGSRHLVLLWGGGVLCGGLISREYFLSGPLLRNSYKAYIIERGLMKHSSDTTASNKHDVCVFNL